MAIRLIAVLLILFSSSISFSQSNDFGPKPYSAILNLASLPLGFEENLGQADPNINFLAHAVGYSVYLSNTAMLFVFDQGKGLNPEVVRIIFGNRLAKTSTEEDDLLPGVSHYYIGNDPTQWKTNVRRFGMIRYRNAYPGVDMAFYGTQKELEFDFDVAPGANVSTIALRIEGARVRKNHQNLELITPSGNMAVLKKPELYQDSDGSRKLISGGYCIRHAQHEIAFSVDRYDHRHKLVIDPALSYSTYVSHLFNTPEEDFARAIAVDGSGAAYVAGEATFDTGKTCCGGSHLFGDHAYVIKLNPGGSSLAYTAFLSGTSLDNQNGNLASNVAIAVDANENAYIVGETNQSDFPVTKGSFSTTAVCASGGSNIVCKEPFAAKLDANGNLVYSTFLVQAPATATASPVPSSIAVDGSGALYVTGAIVAAGGLNAAAGLTTSSTAFQKTPKSNSSAFVLKLHPDASTLDYSTYLGGSTGETPGGIAVDSNGIAYVDGGTSSPDFPTTPTAFQTTNSGTSAFFTQVATDGSNLIYSTLLGAAGIKSEASAIALDSAKSAYLAGMASGNGFPTTSGAFQTTVTTTTTVYPYFVSKFDSAGSLSYSTYLGLISPESVAEPFPPLGQNVAGISVDSTGAYLVATTSDPNFPVLNPIQPFIPSPGISSAITVSKLNPSGTALLYSTFFGTFAAATAMAVDGNQNVYFTGNQGTVPSTAGALQLTPNTVSGGTVSDLALFVSKIVPSLGSAVPVAIPRQASFFPILQQGQTSSPIPIILGNYGDASLTVSSITFAGADPGDFAQTNNCGSAVGAGKNCTINATFTPTVPSGVRTANLTLNFGGGLPSQTVALQGTSGFSVFQGPASVDFGPGIVGIPLSLQPACCAFGAATINNTGSGPLLLSSVSILGADFTIGNSPTEPPIIPTEIPAGSSASIPMTFLPTAPGTRTGTLVIQDNAAGSPHMIQLTGVGVGSGDFGVGSETGSASATVMAGQAASYQLSVAAASGFMGTITFSCSGLPVGASCSSNPLAMTGPALTNSTLSVSTTGKKAALLKAPFHGSGPWWSLATALGIILVHRRRPKITLVALLGLMLLGTMVSCGGGGSSTGGQGSAVSTPSGTFQFTVTAASGNTSHTTQLTLIVQ